MLYIILTIVILIIIITGIGVAAKQHNKKFNENKEKFQEKINEISKQMTSQLDDYLNKQRNDIQSALKEINDLYENKKENVAEQISLLEEGLSKAKERQEQQFKELDKKTAEIVNSQAKIEATQVQNVIDYYQNQQAQIVQEFENFKENTERQKEEILKDLEKEQKKQIEIIEQYKREEEIKQNKDFYRIKISENDKTDIKKLKELSYSFSKPEILLKLIYETYYKTKIEELFKRILGDDKNSSGIYKITNTKNNKSYIGKTTKFIDRWRTHAKRGCGIERINGLLYDAMFEDGLENFTWEKVLICSKDELVIKEKEMIDFYKSNEYGYNIRKG